MESWQIDLYVGLDSTDESFWKYYKSSYENTNAPKNLDHNNCSLTSNKLN